jgi:hypothetical protein
VCRYALVLNPRDPRAPGAAAAAEYAAARAAADPVGAFKAQVFIRQGCHFLPVAKVDTPRLHLKLRLEPRRLYL